MKNLLKALLSLTLITAFLLTGCDTTDVSSEKSSEASQNHVETTNFWDIDLSAYEGMSLAEVAWIDNDNFALLLRREGSSVLLRCCLPEKHITTLFEHNNIVGRQTFRRNGSLYFVGEDLVLQIDAETFKCNRISDESICKNYLAHISSRGVAVYKNENNELVMFDFLNPENKTLLLDQNGDPIEVKSEYDFSPSSFDEKLWSTSGNYFLYRKNPNYYIFDVFGNLCSVSDAVIGGYGYEIPLYDSFLYGYDVEIFPDGTQSDEKYYSNCFPENGAVFEANRYYIPILDRDTQELRLVCYTDGEETEAITVDYTKRYSFTGNLLWDTAPVRPSPDQTHAILFLRGVGLTCGVVKID